MTVRYDKATGRPRTACVNEDCEKDPLESLDRIFVTVDGDCACSPACARAWKKQMDNFCTNIAPSEEKTRGWLLDR